MYCIFCKLLIFRFFFERNGVFNFHPPPPVFFSLNFFRSINFFNFLTFLFFYCKNNRLYFYPILSTTFSLDVHTILMHNSMFLYNRCILFHHLPLSLPFVSSDYLNFFLKKSRSVKIYKFRFIMYFRF